MEKLSLRDVPVEYRRVLVRVDFNVPLDHSALHDVRVADDSRLLATLPTLRYLLDRNARVVLCSHLGRPKGNPDPRESLRPVAAHLRILLQRELGREIEVGFCPETVGLQAVEMARNLEPGAILLLENLRFQPQEEANDAAFARQLAALADLYIDDAFGSAHRTHASTVGVTQFLQPAAAGLLMENELRHLGRAIHNPRHPYVVILGGAKIADKIPIIEGLARHADAFLIGGGMAFTFLTAQGQPIGDSLFEPDKVALAHGILDRAARGDFRLLLPSDHVVAAKPAPGVPREIVTSIAPGQKALDIGPRTRALYGTEIAAAQLIVWNGPMGVFEVPPFDQGTVAVARAVAASSAVSIVGGGDSFAAVHAAGVADRITHVSTGGGASLEFLAGKTLPGVAALTDKV